MTINPHKNNKNKLIFMISLCICFCISVIGYIFYRSSPPKVNIKLEEKNIPNCKLTIQLSSNVSDHSNESGWRFVSKEKSYYVRIMEDNSNQDQVFAPFEEFFSGDDIFYHKSIRNKTETTLFKSKNCNLERIIKDDQHTYNLMPNRSPASDAEKKELSEFEKNKLKDAKNMRCDHYYKFQSIVTSPIKNLEWKITKYNSDSLNPEDIDTKQIFKSNEWTLYKLSKDDMLKEILCNTNSDLYTVALSSEPGKLFHTKDKKVAFAYKFDTNDLTLSEDRDPIWQHYNQIKEYYNYLNEYIRQQPFAEVGIFIAHLRKNKIPCFPKIDQSL